MIVVARMLHNHNNLRVQRLYNAVSQLGRICCCVLVCIRHLATKKTGRHRVPWLLANAISTFGLVSEVVISIAS